MEHIERLFRSALILTATCGLLLTNTGCNPESTEPTSSNDPSEVSDEWTVLLDEDLSQWDMYLGFRLPPEYAGEVPTDEDGNPLEPVGYNNNVNDVFTVSLEDGEPVLRISGEYYGAVFTKESFENYHFTLQVKWGDLKWDPRKELLKDSGILYHSIGENGIDYFHAWKESQEFQIMVGHMGDYWSVGNTAVDIRALRPERSMDAVASITQPFLPIGRDSDLAASCLRSADFESPPGQWTTLDLIAFEDKSLHIVNGEVAMVLRNSRRIDGDQIIPLTGGQIQLQSEAAEVFFKDIRIRSLDALPAEYAVYYE